MRKNIICILVMLLLVGTAIAQECGPSCPACSGGGSNSGALLTQNVLMFSGLMIPSADEEKTVFNSKYGVFKWLDAGLGYAVETEKILWNVRTQLLFEKENSWQPGLIVGSGSVQTGGSDQSLYAQLMKTLKVNADYNLQLSVGSATLLPDFDETFLLSGASLGYKNQFAMFLNYDGKSYHEGISWIANEQFSLSLLLVESEALAFSISIRK